MRMSTILPTLLPGAVLVALMLGVVGARAGEVEIVHASFRHSSPGIWSVEVTLKHADSGWEHYADAWRVVAANGTVLATRTLYHPHVNEQPFTRGLAGVAIPEATQTVFIEAHDKVHGWSPKRLPIDLGRSSGDGFEVSR
jgi:hypothetical protein